MYDFIAHHLNNIKGMSWDSWGFAAIGATVQLLLTIAYQRFIWWPIHPLIFPVGAIWCTHQLMPAIFVAWAVKAAVLHYGGVKLYRSIAPPWSSNCHLASIFSLCLGMRMAFSPSGSVKV